MPAPPIRLIDAAARAGSATLVEGLDFEVARGETLALLGRSGSGKTTALKLINRLRSPSAGVVLVEGRSTLDWNPIELRRRIGYVIQETGLFPHFTVEQNVGLVPRLLGRPAEEIRRRSRELLVAVGLDPDEVGGRYPRSLSGGQRQRVGVARALAADPPILLMDEPFGALDSITRADLQREFVRWRDGFDKAVVFVTHDVAEAVRIGHRIGVMERGRLVWTGSVEEFRAADADAARSLREGRD